MQRTAERRRQTIKRKQAMSQSGMAKEIAVTILCFLIARAATFGAAAPLGVAIYAVAFKKGRWGFLHLASVVVGMFSAGCEVQYLLAVAFFALAAIFDPAWAFRSRNHTAAFAAGAVVLPGIYFVIKQGVLFIDILSLLLSAIVVFAGVLLFHIALPIVKNGSRKYLQHEEVVALAALFSVAALGVPQLVVLGVSIKNVLCIVITLYFALSQKPGVAAAAGIICGTILGLSGPNLFSYVGLFGLGGLLCGLFGKLGKAGICLSFFLVDMVGASYVQTVPEVTLGIAEVLTAFVLFVLIPKSTAKFFGLVQTGVNHSDGESRLKQAVRTRLETVAAAFAQMSATIANLTKRGENKADCTILFDKAADRVCKRCRMNHVCWQSHYNDMYDLMQQCLEQIEDNGVLTEDKLPSFFQKRCVDLPGFVFEMNHVYELYKNETVWQKRLEHANSLVTKQLGDVSGLIESLAGELDDTVVFNEELAYAINCALDKKGLTPLGANVFKNPYGRYEVELSMESCRGEGVCNRIIPILNEILERNMKKTGGDCHLKKCTLHFAETPVFQITHAIASVPKKGEAVSGDTCAVLALPSGNVMAAISDGKGSGREAHLQSRETIDLLSRLMTAGFVPEAAVEMANTALGQQMDEEGFATVDLALVNTVSGYADFIKSGACTTYIKRGQTVKRILSHSLPAGILENADVEHKKEELQNGDMLIMMSDGISESFLDEEEMMKAIGRLGKNNSPQRLAAALLAEAKQARGSGEGDDMTVIALAIERKD